jgi:DNA invertase Pin-like site-specific DNA recombinase
MLTESPWREEKAIVYARVSSEEQKRKGFSLPAQVRELKTYCEGKFAEVVDVIETQESAGEEGRKDFGRMLERIRKENIQNIVVRHSDRLSSNDDDKATIKKMMKKEGRKLHCVQTGRVLDAENYEDIFIMDIEAAVNTRRLADLAKKTKDGQRQKCVDHEYPRCAPVGYLNQIDSKNPDRVIIIKDEKRAQYVFSWFEKYSSGKYSVKSLTKEISKTDFQTRETEKRISKPISQRSLCRVLRNRFYTGEFLWNGLIWQGNYEPLISKELFAKVQEILDEKAISLGVGRRDSDTFPFKKFLRCGYCGLRFTASMAKKEYKYYHCHKENGNCQQKSYRAEEIDKLLENGIGNIRLTDTSIQAIKEMIGKADVKQNTGDRKKLKECVVKISKADNKIKNLYSDRLEEKISLQMYQDFEKEIREDRSYWESERAKLSKANLNFKTDAEAIMKMLGNLRESYGRQDILGKRRILEIILKQAVLKNGEVQFEFREPFNLFFDMAKFLDVSDSGVSER